MASKLFVEALPHLTLTETRDEMCRVADLVNARRLLEKDIRFATVRVGEVLTHPLTKEESFVVQFSDKDEESWRMMEKVEKKLARVSEARGRTREEQWYFEHGDPCLT